VGSTEYALRIDELTLLATGKSLVANASLAIPRGQVHALVGESGSGKTLLSRAAIGLLPSAITRTGGSIAVAGADATHYSQEEWRALRGAHIGMVFQEPMVSLNPAMRIGPQMFEGYRLHRGADEEAARKRALEMMDLFRIARPEERLRQYPHEFSGGMRQRILLSAVMMLEPDLLLADEPTTALDAVVQKEVLDTMVSATRDLGTAVLLVTHDLGVVGRYADHVSVINKGRIEESGAAAALIAAPSADYTRQLLASSPANRPASRPKGERATAIETVVTVRDLKVGFTMPRKGLFTKPDTVMAVDGVSFEVKSGEMLGLVGESGSGKSTIGRAILGLIDQAQGVVEFKQHNVLAMKESTRRRIRPRMQLIFQDPYSALNPRFSVGSSIEAALLHLGRAERRDQAIAMLEATGLGREYYKRFPHELSGGQRQRVCIARALASEPDLVIADESVSALDVTVQAQILDLLVQLQEAKGFACLFISHDLDVVRSICPRTLILRDGRIVEQGVTADILRNPQTDYARRLVDAFPSLSG
jgi:peptide/nickel transport system ATP-binding protein